VVSISPGYSKDTYLWGAYISRGVERQALYRQLADYYDKFYWWKDYGKEVDFLVDLFGHYAVKVRNILDVACGTGNHTKILAAKGYKVTGVDLNDDMLRIARKKLGRRATFVQGDMRDLNEGVSGAGYDAVICLFSSIAYNQTSQDLAKTIRGMVGCTRPGGIVVFDTHFTKQRFWDGHRGEDIFDDGRMMGARLGISKRKGDVGEISFSYLIYDEPKTLLLRNDVHRLGLFNRGELLEEMRKSGLKKLETFEDWSIERKASPDQFKDIIFSGQKPPAR